MNNRSQVGAGRKIHRDVSAIHRRSYGKPVLESHLDLLNQGTFSDVTFIVGPSKERVACHQLFLKARSPVFEVMFSERWSQDSTMEVLLEDVGPEIFQKFLQFIYTDTFAANTSEVLELLQISHKYDVQLLVSKCEKLLEIEMTLEDAVDVFQAARKYDKIQLMQKAGDLIAMSLSELPTLPSFSRLDKQTLVYILKRNDLKMKEVDLFHLAVQWGKSQSGLTAQQSLEDILPLIRFPIMPLEEFTKTVLPTGLLSQSTLIDLFTYFGTDAETKKSMASTLKFSTQQRVVHNKLRRLPAVSVALYQEDFVDCNIRRQQYLKLKECLEFNVLDIVDSGPTPSSRIPCSETEKKHVVLSSISFYCPQSTASMRHWEMNSSVSKEFKINIRAKSSLSASYEDLYTRFPLKIQEGKMAEFKFESAVPLENGLHYSITVEEMTNTQGIVGLAQNHRATGVYKVRDLKNIQRHVTTAVGEKRVHFEFVKCSGYSKPQLIYKLGLKGS